MLLKIMNIKHYFFDVLQNICQRTYALIEGAHIFSFAFAFNKIKIFIFRKYGIYAYDELDKYMHSQSHEKQFKKFGKYGGG